MSLYSPVCTSHRASRFILSLGCRTDVVCVWQRGRGMCCTVDTYSLFCYINTGLARVEPEYWPVHAHTLGLYILASGSLALPSCLFCWCYAFILARKVGVRKKRHGSVVDQGPRAGLFVWKVPSSRIYKPCDSAFKAGRRLLSVVLWGKVAFFFRLEDIHMWTREHTQRPSFNIDKREPFSLF